MTPSNELVPGMAFAFRKTLSVAEQALFTGISGNLAPLYVDKLKARDAGAADLVVFELAAAALATTCLNRLGGATRRIGLFDVRFPRSLLVGETLEARAVVEAVDGDEVRCQVTGARVTTGQVVFEGRATLVPFEGQG